MSKMKDFIKTMTRHFGFEIKRYTDKVSSDMEMAFPPDFDSTSNNIIRQVQPFTQTSQERIFVLYESVKYIVKHKIPGDIVECGVWKGGSMMAVALTLIHCGKQDRDLYLYDTFEGMTPPSEQDIDYKGVSASDIIIQNSKGNNSFRWNYVPIDEVKSNVTSTGYSPKKIHFIKGKVEDTLPKYAPKKIAILRLDTDWYESTRHELNTLFPLISKGGVLIIDDYGHFFGARKAVDEYFQENNVKILLNRIDYTGRIGVIL